MHDLFGGRTVAGSAELRTTVCVAGTSAAGSACSMGMVSALIIFVDDVGSANAAGVVRFNRNTCSCVCTKSVKSSYAEFRSKYYRSTLRT